MERKGSHPFFAAIVQGNRTPVAIVEDSVKDENMNSAISTQF